MLRLLPGLFGDQIVKMLDKLDKSDTAQKVLGFRAGSDRLRWFYADELLEKMLLHDPLATPARALLIA